jgi:hypothetical protein
MVGSWEVIAEPRLERSDPALSGLRNPTRTAARRLHPRFGDDTSKWSSPGAVNDHGIERNRMISCMTRVLWSVWKRN